MRAVLLALLLSIRAHAAAAEPPPKLVVLLVVDQMRADYVEWYGASWSHGLRRLLDQGAWLRNARFPYLNTMTCPGHFTISTGAYPHAHGMILNTWYDRTRGKVIDCTDDPAAPLVSFPKAPPHGGDSAKNLLVPTLADEMRAQLPNKPQVAAFSMKARSAIGLAGHRDAVVLWFEGGHWVTSSAFPVAPWVDGYVDQHAPAVSTPWTRLLDGGRYKNEDDAAGEKPVNGWGRTFPHPLDGKPPLARWAVSPAADDYLAGLARAALGQMKLGEGPGTDLLAVSFSATDLIGHQFGPRSHEVQDVLARLDVVIGQLLDALDAQVGKGRYVLAMSADHGVATIPEQARSAGQDAGRLVPTEIRAKVEDALGAELGRGLMVEELQGNDVYLRPGVHDRLVAKPGALARVLAALRAIPGVADAIDGAELADAAAAKDPLRKAAALSFRPGRSGDLLLVPKPNWVVGALGTNHGSIYDYDQRVPVIFFGQGIRPGKYDRPASPADIAPTLGKLVGVKMTKAEGTVIDDVIAPAPVARKHAAAH